MPRRPRTGADSRMEGAKASGHLKPYGRTRRLSLTNKHPCTVTTAVAPELVGFIGVIPHFSYSLADCRGTVDRFQIRPSATRWADHLSSRPLRRPNCALIQFERTCLAPVTARHVRRSQTGPVPWSGVSDTGWEGINGVSRGRGGTRARQAWMTSTCSGQALARAPWIRRVEMRTRAPIFRSRSRSVVGRALARARPANACRRSLWRQWANAARESRSVWALKR